MSKDKKSKKKSIVINGEKFVILYKSHEAKEAKTGTLLGLFDARTMENYVLALKGDPTLSTVMTISILDMVRCVGEADCVSKHKLQKILNEIDFGDSDPKEFKQIIINLAYAEEGDGHYTPKAMVNYVAPSDMSAKELPFISKKKKKEAVEVTE